MNEALQDGRIGPDSFEEDMRAVVHKVSEDLNGWAAERGQVHPMGCTLTGVV